MLQEIRKWNEAFGEGLITEREFLSHLIEIIGEKWSGHPEEQQGDSDVAALSSALDTIKVPS